MFLHASLFALSVPFFFSTSHPQWSGATAHGCTCCAHKSFIPSSVLLFVRPFLCPTVALVLRAFVPPFLCPSVPMYVRSFVRPFLCPSASSFVRQSTRSFVPPFVRASVRSSFRSSIRPSVRRSVPVIVRWFDPSFVRSLHFMRANSIVSSLICIFYIFLFL